MRTRGIGFATALLLLASACTATLSDPREIVLRGAEATSELNSVHVAVGFDGEVPSPLGEGTIPLEGTTIEGDLNLADDLAHFTFAVPALLGLSGEFLEAGDEAFVRTSLSGEKWYRAEAFSSAGPSVDESAAPSAGPLLQLAELLARDDVEATKLEDVACGDQQCYQVELVVPTTALRELEAEYGHADVSHSPAQSHDPDASLDPESLLGDEITITLTFDKSNLWLTQATFVGGATEQGTLTASITLSAFNQPVTISPPPADEIDEGELELP